MGPLSSLKAFKNEQKLQSSNYTPVQSTSSTEFQYLKVLTKIRRFNTRNCKLLPLYMTLSPSACLSHLPSGNFQVFSPEHKKVAYKVCRYVHELVIYKISNFQPQCKHFHQTESKIQILHGCHTFHNIKKKTQTKDMFFKHRLSSHKFTQPLCGYCSNSELKECISGSLVYTPSPYEQHAFAHKT